MIACKTCRFGKYNPPTNRDYAHYECWFKFSKEDVSILMEKAPEKAELAGYPYIQIQEYRIKDAPKQCRAWKQKIQQYESAV